MDRELPLRIRVLGPPPSVAIQVQRGADDLLPPTDAADDTLTFEFTVRVRDLEGNAPPRILGDFAQGSPKDRFIYLNSGKRAGQADSCWDRRAKIPLTGITRAQIVAVLAELGAMLEARIAGTGEDGGPACARVPLLDRGWRVVRKERARAL